MIKASKLPIHLVGAPAMKTRVTRWDACAKTPCKPFMPKFGVVSSYVKNAVIDSTLQFQRAAALEVCLSTQILAPLNSRTRHCSAGVCFSLPGGCGNGDGVGMVLAA